MRVRARAIGAVSDAAQILQRLGLRKLTHQRDHDSRSRPCIDRAIKITDQRTAVGYDSGANRKAVQAGSDQADTAVRRIRQWVLPIA